jgi:hypothetical protein
VRAAWSLEQVTDNGQGNSHARASASTLDDAPCQKRWQRPSKRAADPGDDKERAGEHHDGLAAVSIGSWPIEKRRDGET